MSSPLPGGHRHCANFSTCVSNPITVHDITAPVTPPAREPDHQLPGLQTPRAYRSGTPPIIGVPAPVITYTDVPRQESCPGKLFIARTWKAPTTCANFSTCVQTITVHDVTAPVIHLPNQQDHQLPGFQTPGIPEQATATDNCDAARLS